MNFWIEIINFVAIWISTCNAVLQGMKGLGCEGAGALPLLSSFLVESTSAPHLEVNFLYHKKLDRTSSCCYGIIVFLAFNSRTVSLNLCDIGSLPCLDICLCDLSQQVLVVYISGWIWHCCKPCILWRIVQVKIVECRMAAIGKIVLAWNF